ncbi:MULTISPECIES: flavin monoamine oxidase family protein [unclassified Xanthobacter]|uniref:flavin monoamine oxidase family protein n=1 Tax=unclassified Xanthobacter TaxID=2623496 RepID=UPI001EDF93A2|nr:MULTISPECIES: FAD-dependent oxidoreductase [unclassified Xanthobacter]
MLDTAIIGGGLCGLALARQLHRQDRDFALYEARPRLGGRILTAVSATSGEALDLGPTWFWPDSQPLISAFLTDLDIPTFLQHDEDAVLHLTEADKSAQPVATQGVHGGARRVEGGLSRVIATLAAELPEDSIHRGHVLVALADKGDHVTLTLRSGDCLMEVDARHVVLALPPRLVVETVAFTPELDAATREAMAAAPTWMAAQAKVVIVYTAPHWRHAGQSGNAFVTHEQAVVGEIFDACNANGTKAALGGFLAFPPELRESFAVGLPMLMKSQMVQVFGTALDGEGELHYQDWAREPFTCSARDRAEPAGEHVAFSNPLLRRPLWDGRLYLGGSETATQGAGYLEGALEAARRIDRALTRQRVADALNDGLPTIAGTVNAISLARFAAWVSGQNDAAFDMYRSRLNRALASQEREQLTQRAMLGAIEDIYERAVDLLDTLPFDMREVPVEKGRSALMTQVQAPFRDFIQTLLDDVVAFNRTSCALSNFPGEHHLSKDYVQTILRDVAAAWRDFSLAANRRLLAKAEQSAAQPHLA